jgi:thiol-disulfide isomerase/thioredoxin
MSKYVTVLAAALVVALAGRAAAADALGIGDPAPKMQVKEFVKGEPVAGFDKGKIYVVEFWATWCGPCRVSIPHLTELQKKHKDVTFIGVSVWESDQAAVKPFVKEMGDKMDYRVAVDDVPAGDPNKNEGKTDPNDGKMAKAWMQAAGQNGIPSAFIVNGDGKVAWIGHPMEMEKPLDQVVSGKYDLQAAAAEFKKAQAQQAKMAALMAKYRAAGNDPKGRLAVLDEAIKDDPSMENMLGMAKFQALKQIGDAEKTVEYGNHMVKDVLKDNAQGLNAVAWALVEKPGEKPDANLMKLGLRAAQRADELKGGKDGAIADTLAKAYFESGDAAKALETQERALKLVEGTPQGNDPGLKERLEQYRKAAKK